MATESRTALRTSPSAIATQPERRGMNRTRRTSTTGAGSGGEIVLTVPLNADCMVIENIGTQEIRFVFGSPADPFAQRWTLLPNNGVLSRSPEFAVNKNTVVTVRSTVDIGDIQYMFWG